MPGWVRSRSVLSLRVELRAAEASAAGLARSLSGAPPGSAVVFDQELGATTLTVTAFPSLLLEELVPAGGPFAPRAGPPAPSIGPEEGGLPYVLVPADGPRGGVLRDHATILDDVRATAPPRLAPVHVQTFWAVTRARELVVARRIRPLRAGREAPELPVAIGGRLARDWALRVGWGGARAEPLRGWGADRAWRSQSSAGLPPSAWARPPFERLSSTLAAPPDPKRPSEVRWNDHHLAVFGSSGSGKTQFLADLGAAAASQGASLLALDVHGDLGPAIVARLGAEGRRRLRIVDIESRPVPGIDVLAPRDGDDADRLAGHLVAALRRLAPDGEETYWGFRLERVFDAFVRLAVEAQGNLVDLAALLADPRRREAARVTTSRPELASFLEELEPIVKRHPDFLWSAGSRLAKIVLHPALRELLAPTGDEAPLGRWLEDGGIVILRLPFAQIGPEAVGLATTLLLTRLYLDRAAHIRASATPPSLWILDEAQSLSAPLLTELLTESRKFGVRVALASQYPSRLPREAAAAVAGAVGAHLSFRVPLADAPTIGRWLGLDADDARSVLSQLPTGVALLEEGGLSVVRSGDHPPTPAAADRAWAAARARLPAEPPTHEEDAEPPDARTVVVAAATLEEERGPGFSFAALQEQVLRSAEIAGAAWDGAWRTALRRRWIVPAGQDAYRLGGSGAALVGWGRATGAVRESPEHRALLEVARRVVARKGALLEVERQGRFDSPLPDGRIRLLPVGSASPREWGHAVDRARASWAWRFFDGRDVHVEAEVTGALRPERIRRGIAKAVAAHAFVLFLVSDAGRARRVRATLRAAGLSPRRGQVWTLPAARRTAAPDYFGRTGAEPRVAGGIR